MATNGRSRDETVLITALASGKTNQEASDLSGIPERTVYRRLKKPVFKQRVAEARDDIFQRVNGQLADINAAAVQRLDELIHSRNETVAIQAIRLALDHTRKQRESTQEQAAEGVKITEIVLHEPHYGQAEREADLRELRGGA